MAAVQAREAGDSYPHQARKLLILSPFPLFSNPLTAFASGQFISVRKPGAV